MYYHYYYSFFLCIVAGRAISFQGDTLAYPEKTLRPVIIISTIIINFFFFFGEDPEIFANFRLSTGPIFRNILTM